MTSALEIDVETTRDSRVVRLSGEVDLATAHQLRDALVRASEKTVLVDLADVTFLDSSGIGVLLSARERAASDGTRLVVERASDAVRQVFGYTGLSWLLAEPHEEGGG